MSSGVTVQAECVTAFQDIKLGRKYRYIVYALTSDLREITVNKTAPPEASYDDLVEDLKEAELKGEGRYAVYDANYVLEDGQRRTKLVFFLWAPGNAKIRQRMVYTSSTQSLKKELEGIGKGLQANDQSDLHWSNVLEHLQRV